MIATTTTTAMATTTKTGGRGSQPFSKRIRLPELNPIGLPAGDTENLRRDYSQRIETVYTNDLGSAEAWVEKHLGMSHRNADSDPLILGWDTESTPYLPWLEHRYDSGTYFGPATIQLGTPTSSLVLQVAEDGFGPIHEGGLPSFLSDVLEDPGIIPVGVGLDDDMVELYRWCLDVEQTNGGDGPPTSYAGRSRLAFIFATATPYGVVPYRGASLIVPRGSPAGSTSGSARSSCAKLCALSM